MQVEFVAQPSDSAVAARLLVAPRSVLAVVVNETAVDARRPLTLDGRRYQVPVAAGRSRLALFERETGRLLVATAGEAIEETGPAETRAEKTGAVAMPRSSGTGDR